MSELTTTAEQPENEFLSRPLLPAINLDWEKTIYLIFIIVAIVTRFWALGDRVMSHDESLHTQYSFQYFDGQGYNHTPLMHGPFLFHITALSYWLFGDSDFSARIPVAIFGVILVIFPYFLRPWLGRIGAIFSSFIFLISPFIAYYSRYIRHDIYVIMWSLIVFTAMWYYFRERKDLFLWFFVAGTALMFSTKEVAFIYVAIFGSFLVIRLLARFVGKTSIRSYLVQIRIPMLVILAGVLVAGAGFIASRSDAIVVDSQTTAEATEGFAADPNADAVAVDPSATSTTTIVGWLQILGIGIFAGGLFLAARTLRPELEIYPEFDLIILFSTLLLPLVSPLLTKLAGWNPTDYTLNTCLLEGQESMTTLQILIGRLSQNVCWSSFFESGIVRSGIFLVITMVIGVLIGLWWDKRRWIIAAIIFNGIILVLFTSVFTNLGGWSTGVIGSLGYWLEQQAVQRGSQPSYYYRFIVPFYEFLPLIFSLLAVRLWTQKQGTNKFYGYWIGTILLAMLAHSLVNWLYGHYTGTLAGSEESTQVPGLISAAIVVLAAFVLWFAYYRAKIIEEQGLEHGIRDLFDASVLLEFVPFVIWWLVMTWIAYSYAGEKMPWLSTHFVIPMSFLAGWYFNEKLLPVKASDLFTLNSLVVIGLTILLVAATMLVIGPLLWGNIRLGDQQLESLTNLGRFIGGLLIVGIVALFWRRAYQKAPEYLRNPLLILSVFIMLSILTIRFAYMAAFPNADYTTEFMVYAHGAPATKSVVLDQVEELSMRLYGDKSIRVAFDSDVSWPLTWYLRDYPQRVFFGESPSQSLNESPVIIVGAKNWNSVEPYLGDNYEYTEHTFLWWPMEEYRNISWNAILGDPTVPAEQRRGLGNPDVRQAIWDIFFYRDYQKYGEVFGGTYTAGQWPLRHNLRLYMRKDVLPTLWDYGIGAVAAAEIVDPYKEGELTLHPTLVFNEAGIAGAEEGMLNMPRNMAVAPNGHVYVLDSGNHRLQVFDRDGSYLMGWGTFGTGAGEFNEPWGIAIDDQFVYVADTWNHRLQKFTLDGEFVAQIGESGSPGVEEGDEGLGLFFGPRSLAVMEDGRLVVTDTGNHRMQVLDAEGSFEFQVGGFGNDLGQMNEPVGIGKAPDGSIYLTDTWNSRVQRFTPELFAIAQWPVDAWEGTSINNKPYVAIDSAGRVYVTDPEGYRVLIFDAEGDYIGRFGSFGPGPTNFGLPNGITIDAEDNIYVADAGNSRILKFTSPFSTDIDMEVPEELDKEVEPGQDSDADQAIEGYPIGEE